MMMVIVLALIVPNRLLLGCGGRERIAAGQCSDLKDALGKGGDLGSHGGQDAEGGQCAP